MREATAICRAVKNFLDLAHFPFVHPNILGIEEQAGVEQYEVEIAESGNEIWTTECKFYRPLAGAFGERFGETAHYKYRVAHPFSAIIYTPGRCVVCKWIIEIINTGINLPLSRTPRLTYGAGG